MAKAPTPNNPSRRFDSSLEMIRLVVLASRRGLRGD